MQEVPKMIINIDPNFIMQCGEEKRYQDAYDYIAQKVAEYEQDINDQAELFDGMVEQK